MKLLLALASSVVLLAACGGGGDPTTGAAPVEQQAGPVPAGGSFTYPDGLVVTVGDWREESNPGSTPSRMMALDVTASNPTDGTVETTQAFVSVRAGDAGERLTEWAVGDSLDAVLQPGAEAAGSYFFDVPGSEGHVVATVSWLEAEDAEVRPDVEFVVED